MLTIAIGDIHGMADKLNALLGGVEDWLRANAKGKARKLVFLGDYIDRGPQTREVLQTVQALQRKGAICLKGNHEDLLIHAEDSDSDLANFLLNGGDATLASLQTREAFDRAREWMLALPTSYEDDLRYFVHAGVMPGIPLETQSDEIKLWIRDRFLRHSGPFPKYVVHGHTPTISRDPSQTTPDILDNRCNVDTGAGIMGPLSAAIFNARQAKPIHTVSVGESGQRREPPRAPRDSARQALPKKSL